MCALALIWEPWPSALAVAQTPTPGAASRPQQTQKYTVNAGDTAYAIAKRFGITVAELAAANGLAAPYTMEIGRVLTIPAGGTAPAPDIAGGKKTYTVAPRDTLYSIARRAGVTVQDVAALNGIVPPYPLTIGQVLALPASATAVPAQEPQTHPSTHVVRRGDTAYNISQRYGITVQELEQANGLKQPYILYIGQVLTLPPNALGGPPVAAGARPAGTIQVHTVEAGDTLYSIARRYGRSVEAITSLNHLTPPYTLAIGSQILIPPEEGAARPPAPAVPAPPPAPGQPPQPMPPISQAPPPPPKEAEIPAKTRRTGLLSSFEFNLSGVVRSAFDYKTGQIQVADMRLEPSFSFSPFDDWTFYAKGRFRADAEDRLEIGRPSQATRSSANRRWLIGDRAELELREAYLQGKAATINWTIGKQAIVWGESDGLKVLDVVDPQSYREFILEPYDQSRIPRWSVRAEKRIGGATFEGVVLLDSTYNEYPPTGSTFDVVSAKLKQAGLLGSTPVSLAPVNALLASLSPLVPYELPVFPDTVGNVILEPTRRTGAAKEPDFGGRIKTYINGWDLSFLYYRHTDLDPSMKTGLTAQGLTLTPEYNRVNLIGGSFANAFGNFTVRGEFGYTTDRYFATQPDVSSLLSLAQLAGMTPAQLLAFAQTLPSLSFLPSLDDLKTRVQRDNFAYILGVDYFGIRNTVVSLQFFQNSILHPPTNLLEPKTSYSGTFYVRHSALNQKLTAEFQSIVNFTDGDAVLRPKLKYDFRDNVSGFIGADIFVGNQNGIFGTFKDANRIFAGIDFSM